MRWFALLFVLVALAVAVWLALDASRVPATVERANEALVNVARDEVLPETSAIREPAARVEASRPEGDAAALTVTVVDAATGVPLAEASVRLALYTRDGEDIAWFGEGAETNADGYAEFETVAPARRVVASKQGFKASWADADSPTVTIQLHASASVYGRVLDASTREPIVGARVELDKNDIPPLIRPRCISDVDGAYRLDGLFPRSGARVIVRIDACVPWTDDVKFGGPGAYEHDLVIDFGHTFRGRVLNAMTSAPIEGARIEFVPSSEDEVTASGVDGAFVVRGIPLRGIHAAVTASKAGYVGSLVNVDVDTFDFSREFVLPMLGECVIDGTVLDSSNSPCADVIVGRKARRGESASDEWRKYLAVDIDPLVSMNLVENERYPKTDAMGRFRIAGLRPWCDYSLWVVLGAERIRRTVRFDEPGETKSVVLKTLRGTATVSGTIWVDGKVVPQCGLRWMVDENVTDVFVAPDGAFVAEHVVSGRVELEAEYAFGGGTDKPHLRQRVTLDVRDGEALRQDFALRFDPARIDGLALDDADQPVPGLPLAAARSNPSARVLTVTDAEGRFVFGLPDALGGEWWVQPTDPAWTPRGGGFIAGSSGVSVHFERAK